MLGDAGGTTLIRRWTHRLDEWSIGLHDHAIADQAFGYAGLKSSAANAAHGMVQFGLLILRLNFDARVDSPTFAFDIGFLASAKYAPSAVQRTTENRSKFRQGPF
jgi:hypothetical protein